MQTVFVSGHLDLTDLEFEVHYLPGLTRAVSRGDRFVVGDARGADWMAMDWLAARGADVTVFHMFDAPRHLPAGVPTRGGYTSDEHRDSALTAASDADVAWVRPGRERSGTARNLLRRGHDGPPRVVLASEADWDRCRSLRLTSLLDSPDAFASTFDDEASRPPPFWVDRARNPDVDTLIAACDHRDAGLSVVAPHEAGDGAVYSVWVSALCRGRGVGDRLMEAVVEAGRSRGYGRLLLDVGVANPHARRLYERHGFVPTGRRSALPPPRDHVLEIELARPL